MATIVLDRTTRRFSIQGETGIQLRRLKEFLDKASDVDVTPKTPVFYRDMDINKSSRLEYQINNLLNTHGLKIMDYMEALIHTRKYDVLHGTKILDNGFVIILRSSNPLDGNDVGALINLKDRKGKDIYTYSVPSGEPLDWKQFKLSNIKAFSINRNSREYKEFGKKIVNKDNTWLPIDKRDIPLSFRNKVKEVTEINTNSIDFDDQIEDVEYLGKLISEDDNNRTFEFGEYYVTIPENKSVNSIIKVYK
jgi:hypothetical protein